MQLQTGDERTATAGLPAKKALKKQVFGPDNAMDRLVWCVADGTDRIRLGSLLWLTFKAFCLAPQMDCHLHVIPVWVLQQVLFSQKLH